MTARARIVQLARAIAMAFAAFFACVQFTPLTQTITKYMAIRADQPTAPGGVLIVLGAEQHADGTLGVMSYWRCFYTVRAWQTGQFSKVLVSGGPSNHRIVPDGPEAGRQPPLADAMAGFLTALGIPRDAILVEPASSNTHLNAVYSAPLLRGLPGPYTLVTSDFHMLRAQRCFGRAGIRTISRPAPDILKRSSDWRQRWQCSIVLAEEWVKLGYYRWRGWI